MKVLIACSACHKQFKAGPQGQYCPSCRKERLRAAWKSWYYRTPEQQAQRKKGRKQKTKTPNPRNKAWFYERVWLERNRAKRRAINRRLNADRLRRVPLWADLKAIERIYQGCPSGYHVDHVVPLLGRNVSGLHVENNLQYLPARENIAKGNSFAP